VTGSVKITGSGTQVPLTLSAASTANNSIILRHAGDYNAIQINNNDATPLEAGVIGWGNALAGATTLRNAFYFLINTSNVPTASTRFTRYNGTSVLVDGMFTANGRLLLGTTTESTFLLDVNGTARVSGALTISSGTTSPGTFIGPGGSIRYTSESGVNTNAVYCSGNTTTQDVIISYVGGNATSNINSYIQTSGYIGTKGGLRLGAASGTDVITALTNTWLNVAAGTTARSQINLASSTAPTSPNNGDIWFDGTDLKIRVGGLTRTIVLL
jgi:hypothetical protein